LRFLFDLEGGGRDYLANLQSVLTAVVSNALQPLQELTIIAQTLEDLGCTYQVSASAVGPFEYYTGPALQFEVNGVKVGGGGRYDHLVALVGGPETPATGYALNVDAILSLLAEEPAQTQTVTIISGESASELAEAFSTAQALRQKSLIARVRTLATGKERWRLSLASVENGQNYVLYDAHGSVEHKSKTLEEVAATVKGGAHD
jgi:histidyl-tRNA synthetase